MTERRYTWSPDPEAAARSAMAAFARFVGQRRGRVISPGRELHRESVRDVAAFWSDLVDFTGLRVGGDTKVVLEGDDMATARFFPGATVSYVSHLLDPPQPVSASGLPPPPGPEAPAVVAMDETGRSEVLTRAELRARVRKVAKALLERGVGPGDRVVGLCRLTAATLVAHLGALAIGAVWSSAAPDMGAELLLARAGQVEPKVLFADARYPYHGASRDNRERLAAIVERLPSVERTIALDDEAFRVPRGDLEVFSDLLAGEPLVGPLPELPFNHPLLVLFSSGTTGLPKCIVHGAGGSLLEHVKEHRLHCDLGPGDRLLYHTTTGWMMFNWLVSALATGATVVLHDGSVSHPEADSLFRRVADAGVTVLGTSATYLQYCRDAGLVPRESLDLSRLRLLLSTGSVLSAPLYDWVAENVGELPVHSISGGTDIVGCFVMGSPTEPVTRGESPSLGLGLDVRAAATGPSGVEFHGVPAEGSVTGELVCVAPFPSRPLGLHGDADGSRFKAAYFAENPGVWTHGDTIEITSRGTARILGRSDGVLNVRGIRVGPGEIYAALEGVPEITAACAVEQRAPDEPGGSRLVLLVVLREGETLARPLALRIKRELATRASQAHVPAVVAQVDDLPRTHNGKPSERAARDAVNGDPVKNRSALRNPECLDTIGRHPDIASVRSE